MIVTDTVCSLQNIFLQSDQTSFMFPGIDSLGPENTTTCLHTQTESGTCSERGRHVHSKQRQISSYQIPDWGELATYFPWVSAFSKQSRLYSPPPPNIYCINPSVLISLSNITGSYYIHHLSITITRSDDIFNQQHTSALMKVISLWVCKRRIIKLINYY